MGHKRSLDGLLAEKDEKIAILEHHIQGYVGRLSLLQSRLLATLDTLDVIQTHHAQELGNALRHQTLLREKLDAYTNVVRAAELERDDMRDAVLKLIEKVETSNDYRGWPHSQIRLSSLADPLAVTESPPAPTLDKEQVISYASALNEILRRERDDERRAHAQTREVAEARILVLEAKLSRREAELEAGVERPHPAEPVVVQETTPRARARTVEVEGNEGIPSDQIIAILDDTVARNKLLEKEISTLYRRLENARAAAASEHPSDDPPPRLNPRGMSRSTVSSHLDSPSPISPMLLDRGNQSTSSLDVDHEDHDVLKDLEQQIKLLSDKIDAFADERHVLLQTVSLTRPIESDSHEHLETRLRILENECLGLKASQNALRDELDATRAHAHAQENELLDAITSLRLTLTASPLQPQQRTHEPYQMEPAVDLLEPPDDDGEVSMELATPLLPLTAIPASPISPNAEGSHGGDERQGSPYIDPPSIPLPSSPEDDHDHDLDESRFDVDLDLDANDANDANDADIESEPDDSPTLSHIVLPMLGTATSRSLYRATSDFVAELRQVESEIAEGARGRAAGEGTGTGVEGVVCDLRPP